MVGCSIERLLPCIFCRVLDFLPIDDIHHPGKKLPSRRFGYLLVQSLLRLLTLRTSELDELLRIELETIQDEDDDIPAMNIVM